MVIGPGTGLGSRVPHPMRGSDPSPRRSSTWRHLEIIGTWSTMRSSRSLNVLPAPTWMPLISTYRTIQLIVCFGPVHQRILNPQRQRWAREPAPRRKQSPSGAHGRFATREMSIRRTTEETPEFPSGLSVCLRRLSITMEESGATTIWL